MSDKLKISFNKIFFKTRNCLSQILIWIRIKNEIEGYTEKYAVDSVIQFSTQLILGLMVFTETPSVGVKTSSWDKGSHFIRF